MILLHVLGRTECGQYQLHTSYCSTGGIWISQHTCKDLSIARVCNCCYVDALCTQLSHVPLRVFVFGPCLTLTCLSQCVITHHVCALLFLVEHLPVSLPFCVAVLLTSVIFRTTLKEQLRAIPHLLLFGRRHHHDASLCLAPQYYFNKYGWHWLFAIPVAGP